MVEEILADVVVTDGQYILWSSLKNLDRVDETLPNSGPLAKQLEGMIDENPGGHFVSGHLNSLLVERSPRALGSSSALRDLPGFENLAAVATEIVEAFESLPWRYRMHVQLPEALQGLLHEGENEWILSQSTRIVRITAENQSQFAAPDEGSPRASRFGFGLLSGLFSVPPASIIGKVALVTEVSGYVGEFETSAPLRSAVSTLRAFFGLTLAFRLAYVVRSYASSIAVSDVGLWIYRDQGAGFHAFQKHRLETDLTSQTDQMAALANLVRDESQKASLFASSRALIQNAFMANDDARRLRLAARWYFDSLANDRELLAFVQAMICMEILLGDRADASQLGIGDTIRNRCAYLIGTSPSERTLIVRDLNAIYDVRSKIVHTGKESLSDVERAMLSRLRELCRRVLMKEAEQLAGSQKLSIAAALAG